MIAEHPTPRAYQPAPIGRCLRAGARPKPLLPHPNYYPPYLLLCLNFRFIFVVMYRRVSILFFLVGVFTVLSVSSASACGKSTAASCGATSSGRSCCEAPEKAREEASGEQQGSCSKDHPGQPCSGHGGCGGEHCPCGCMATTGSSGGLLGEAPLFSSSFSCKKLRSRAFYFAEHLPEAVYLPIWQPPQLVA